MALGSVTNTNKNWSPSLSVSSSEEKYSHSVWRLTLILITIVIFLVSIFLNTLDSTDSSIFGVKIFGHTSYKSFLVNPTELTYSIWLANFWIVIYIWQLAWLIYGLTTICRKSSSDYLYKYPPVMHWIIYLNFIISNILHVGCIYFWSNNLFILGTSYAFLMFTSLYISGYTSLFKLSDYQREMYYTEKTKDVWCIRVLVQNGTFLYASWSFLMFLFSLEVLLVYKIGISKQTAHLITLGIIAFKLIAYFLIENVFAYKYCKFLLTPWLMIGLFLIDALINSLFLMPRKNLLKLDQNDLNTRYLESNILTKYFNINSFLLTCLVLLFIFCFLCKIIKFVWSEFCYRKKLLNNF